MSIRKKNREEADVKLDKINIYQEPAEKVGEHIGKEAVLIDTGTSDAFLESYFDRGRFFFRLKAYRLGADAIVNYQETSNKYLGTPVRFVSKH